VCIFVVSVEPCYTPISVGCEVAPMPKFPSTPLKILGCPVTDLRPSAANVPVNPPARYSAPSVANGVISGIILSVSVPTNMPAPNACVVSPTTPRLRNEPKLFRPLEALRIVVLARLRYEVFRLLAMLLEDVLLVLIVFLLLAERLFAILPRRLSFAFCFALLISFYSPL